MKNHRQISNEQISASMSLVTIVSYLRLCFLNQQNHPPAHWWIKMVFTNDLSVKIHTKDLQRLRTYSSLKKQISIAIIENTLLCGVFFLYSNTLAINTLKNGTVGLIYQFVLHQNMIKNIPCRKKKYIALSRIMCEQIHSF